MRMARQLLGRCHRLTRTGPPPMGNYLGLDIGTSGCKAVVFDRRGRILSSAHREYDLITAADGTAELDSEIVIARCFEVITTTARAAGTRNAGFSRRAERAQRAHAPASLARRVPRCERPIGARRRR